MAQEKRAQNRGKQKKPILRKKLAGSMATYNKLYTNLRRLPAKTRTISKYAHSSYFISNPACIMGVRYYMGSSLELDSSQHVVDLRSDCLSVPTPAMLEAMQRSSTGDDVLNEDDNVHELQSKMADLFGKPAALFVPSGTMGNLISMMSHTAHARGLEVLLGDMSHIVMYEQGGMASVAHVNPRTMQNYPDGTFDLNALDSYVRPQSDPHQPWTAVVSVENTHNNCGGKVLPISFLENLRAKAVQHGLKVHMDGARLMNAAVHLGVQPVEILQHVDSVTMCFTKGVGAPVGSAIAGDAEFIERAVRLRKLLGGGWRKPGLLAAAALHAMIDVRERMTLDHAHAQQIATAIIAVAGDAVHVDVAGVHTNLVLVEMRRPDLTAPAFCARLAQVTEEEEKELGARISVRALAFYPTIARLAIYSSIKPHDIEAAIAKLQYVVKELAH